MFMARITKPILFGCFLLLVSFSCIILWHHKNSLSMHLHKRLHMGTPVKAKLHDRDMIFKHAAVAADNAECSKAGSDALKDGGSAVDAAVASLLCLGVINSHSTGIGGGGFMMVYIRAKEKGEVIDFRESAPKRAHPNLFKGDPDKGIRGGLAVAIPGELRGMELAHKKYGKLPWKRLFQPAIKLARFGFPMPETLSIATHKWSTDVLKEKCMRNLYAPNGTLLKTGEKVINLELADTLDIIANAGNAEPFYRGQIAEIMEEEIEEQGGILTVDDLKDYKAIARKPVTTKLGSYTMLNTPAPASGPILALIMNILKVVIALSMASCTLYPSLCTLKGYNMDNVDLKENPALVYHRIIEAFKYAYARRTLLADPDIEKSVKSLISDMVSEKTARKIMKAISDTTTYAPQHYGGKYDLPVKTGTTHLVVVAQNGDAVTVMDTVNGYLGAKFRSCALGFIYNNEMDDFSSPGLPNEFGLPPAPINFIKPHKRPLSSGVPVIILDEHSNVRMVAGGSGGSIITTAVAQVIMNHLWFDMSLKDAVQKPRVHSQLIPDKVFVETRFPDKLVTQLSKFRHKVEKGDVNHAVVQAIARVSGDWQDCSYRKEDILKCSGLYAESDYRKGGKPAGY